MLATLVPDGVAVAHATGSDLDAPLAEVEAAAVANAVDRRRREFAVGRACARQALARLGIAPTAIPRGPGGAPTWPVGVVGSITHTQGYYAAAVARSRDIVALGIDAEPNAALPGDVLTDVTDQDERRLIETLPAGPGEPSWDRLIFCAKEAVYKVWSPLTGTWLGFEDVRVTLRVDGTFAARLLVPGPTVDGRTLRGFRGRWGCRDGFLLAALTVRSGTLDGAVVDPG